LHRQPARDNDQPQPDKDPAKARMVVAASRDAKIVSRHRARERLRVCASEHCPATNKPHRNNSGAFVRGASHKALDFVGPGSFRR